MLRVVVESAKGLPKKKLGNPDPITSVIFKGKSTFKSLEVLIEFSLRGKHLQPSWYKEVKKVCLWFILYFI